MNYFIMFLTDGVLGYFLQAVGYVLSLYAFSKKKINIKSMSIFAAVLAVFMFLIRQITVISFGYHTILIMIFIILLAVIWKKIPTFTAVISVLATAIVILICEVLNLGVLQLILGKDVMSILQNGTTAHDKILKALLGAPTNIALVLIMTIFYKIRTKNKGIEDGKAM